MKRVDAYLFEGTLYPSQEAARRVIDDRIGAIICPLAREIAATDKYVAAIAFIESHLADFAALSALQAQLTVEEDHEA